MTGSESFTIMPSEPPAPGTDDRKGLMEFGSLTRALQGGAWWKSELFIVLGNLWLRDENSLRQQSTISTLYSVAVLSRGTWFVQGVHDLFKDTLVVLEVIDQI